MIRFVKIISLIFILVQLISIELLGQSEKKFTSDILNNPRKYSEEFEKLFNYNEIKLFTEEEHPNSVLLENGYTKSKIINPEKWKPYDDKIVITQIDIVFTKYPRDKEFWRTNYYDLLAARVKELIKLDSSLNSADFEWNLVLQTQPVTEPEAKELFHGISITYFKISEFLEDEEDADETPEQDSSYFVRNELKVKNFIRSQGGTGDSIVLKVFERHKEWQNALVVMDWTGSMYRYGAQAVLWHTLNFETSGIKNFVFFNDGDETPDERKIIGQTGGIYYAQAKNLERLINTFYLVGKRGKGGDIPENDVEALIKGMNRFEDFDELVLIADNNSCMRDFRLLVNLGVKVNIIVCGATTSGINPQYVNLAYHTGGSIHTIEEDITHLSAKVKDKEITIGNIPYKLVNDELFTMKYKNQALRFESCDEFTTLEPLTPYPHLPFIEKQGGIDDSTVYKVLERHPIWQNLVVVMDWTSGSYVSGAQAVLWHKIHQKTSGIDYFVFFNDGNKLQDRKKKIGKTGGIYYQKSNNIRRVEKRFDYVIRKGTGGKEPANNDLEALMVSATKFTKTDNFVLLADNRTCIRDMNLLKYLNLPIKVVLSHVEGPINPQYINLAFKSGGSLHLLNDDIYNYVFIAMAESHQTLVLNGYEYILNEDGLFEFKDKSLKSPCAKYDNLNWWQQIWPF